MVTLEQIKQIPDMVKGGKTIPQIAQELSCAPKTVTNYIKRLRMAGYEVSTRKGRPPIKII